MKIALAQHNYTVGDIAGNVARIVASIEQAASAEADGVVFSEMAVTGYPPMDLLDQKDFVADALHAITVLQEKSRAYPLVTIVVGGIDRTELDGVVSLYNSAYVLRGGEVVAVYHKSLLPTYDVFDERRYFASGSTPCVVEIAGEKCGVTICEDIWNDRFYWPKRRYGYDPVEDCVARGARMIINISASPYHVGKEREREQMVAALAQRHGVTMVYVNQVGGNDELIFDGHSFVMTPEGCIVHAPGFEEAVVTYDSHSEDEVRRIPSVAVMRTGSFGAAPQDDSESVVSALTLGIRDYTRKCGFKNVVLGLSGGIDSAVTAALAVRALGQAHVRGIGMPSKFSSQGSVDDARQLANNLCIQFDLLPIEPIAQAYAEALAPVFASTAPGVAEENIQARIRGALLMAISNKSGALLLTTGNKSELAVGYCTLYGDMSGGLAVIADLSKGMVYRVARFINEEAGREIIPASTLTKAPSAELRPNQTDQDTLPPYDTLDEIIYRYVEEGQGATEIIGMGFDPAVVGATMRMINQNEYKRRQAAPGLRVTSKAFGVGRRMPIAAKRTRS